jgi:hypothetical protein
MHLFLDYIFQIVAFSAFVKTGVPKDLYTGQFDDYHSVSVASFMVMVVCN